MLLLYNQSVTNWMAGSGRHGSLLLGGRLILIRHVLQALPIHTLAAMNPPLGILRELEGLFSKFFWSNSTDNPRKVWRNWNWLSFPIEENGIGVRKLEDVLLAFTCKLWWKISCLTGIWARYIRAISWERSVLRVRLRAAQAVFDSHIAFQVRDGSSSFWDSNRLGSGPLRLHDLLLSPPPDLTIREVFEGDSQDVLSDYLPNDLLQHVLQHRPTFISQPDCIVWKPSPSGAFTISSAYSMARSRRSQHSLVSSFWASNIPLKTSIFLWRLYNGFVSFPETLIPLGFSLVSKCPHCPSFDSIQHWFCDCAMAVQLWSFSQVHFGLPIHLDQSLWDRFVACSRASDLLIRIIPAALCWLL